MVSRADGGMIIPVAHTVQNGKEGCTIAMVASGC
jgi:hypothetical protein